jgi:hypothetical protein
MSRIISKNRDPRINEFGPNDLALNTVTGDLFVKANNKLFKIVSRNQLTKDTTDSLLKLLSEAADTAADTESGQSATLRGFNLGLDGFYRITTSFPLTGSNVSLHGGTPFDYGQPLPNPPYIKTNGGFDILMDNADNYTNSSFRIFKDTGIAGVSPGVELLKLDENGNLTISGSINGSSTILDEHPKLILRSNEANGDQQIIFKSGDGSTMATIRSDVTNNILNHLSIGAASNESDLVIDTNGKIGIGVQTPGEQLTVTGNISSSGTIVGSTLTGTIDGGSF